MSKIDELIQQYCPDGVEFKTLGETCIKISSGGTPSSSSLEYYGGTIPWLRTQEVDWCDIYDAEIKITESGLKNSAAKWIPENCVIVAMYGATAAKVAINKIPLTTNQACCNLEINETIAHYRYVFYWLCKEYLNLKALGQGSQSNINAQIVKNYTIPLPPLPVQEEIVNILDKFTALEAELEAELEARRQQYQYYRDRLLTFGDEVEWKTLGEVGTLIRGNGLQKKDFVETGIGCIHYGQIYTYYGTFANKTKTFVSPELAKTLSSVLKGDLIIACTSENMEDVCKTVAWLGDNEIVTGGHATIFKHGQNAKFLAYYFQTPYFYDQKKKYARGTKVIDIKASDIAKIQIPIPPLSEQERIVAILDKFDVLVNDISVGLPAELAARRQQYQYYRDRLLTFNPQATEA